jgi:hypothetical protein
MHEPSFRNRPPIIRGQVPDKISTKEFLDEEYRNGYIDALTDIQTLFAGFDDSIDEWIEEKLKANE